MIFTLNASSRRNRMVKPVRKQSSAPVKTQAAPVKTQPAPVKKAQWVSIKKDPVKTKHKKILFN